MSSVVPTTNSNRPKTRQRLPKAPPALDVPNIDEDAPERKRVLNVLAQRRYRTLFYLSPPRRNCTLLHGGPWCGASLSHLDCIKRDLQVY